MPPRSTSAPLRLTVALLIALLTALAGARSAAAQEAPPVVLAASVDGSADAQVVQGRPALVVAGLVHRQAFRPDARPVAVAPAGGGWGAAFRLDVADAQGASVPWPFEVAAAPPGAVQVTGDAGAQWAWALPSDATAALAPGTYTLRLVLDGTALGAAGAVTAAPIRLTVEAAPSAPTAEDRAAHAIRVAEVAAARGDAAGALAALEALVAEQPFHVGARLRQALLLRADRPVAALEAVMYAVEGLPETAGTEPPAVLLGLQDELVHAVEAATSFEVTLGEKPPTHPTAGQGGARAFALDGLSGRELVLRRGVTYTFRMAGVPTDSPFYLTTDPAGGGAAPYVSGVEGAPASSDGALTFTPDEDTPPLLYYASATERHAGWRLHIETTRPTADDPDGEAASLALSLPTPNPTRDRSALDVVARAGQPLEVAVFDMLGRRVALLHDGPAPAGGLRLPIDAATWPAGTYIVRAVTDDAVAARRLTVAR